MVDKKMLAVIKKTSFDVVIEETLVKQIEPVIMLISSIQIRTDCVRSVL